MIRPHSTIGSRLAALRRTLLAAAPTLLATGLLAVPSVRADISGFGTNGSGFTLNQGQNTGGLSVSNNVVTLTDNRGLEGNSIFYNTKQTINAFTVSFTYRDVYGNGQFGATADGFTFTLQNDSRGATAVGGDGGTLGYGAGTATNQGQTARAAISPSAAVEFNIYDPNGTNTGLGTNGALTLTNHSAAILDSGDPINIRLTYNGTTLTETLTDANIPANTSTFSYTVNLASVLGGNTAYVGFTGADGGVNSFQTISNFQYTVVPEPATWAAGALLIATTGLAMRRRCSHGSRRGQASFCVAAHFFDRCRQENLSPR